MTYNRHTNVEEDMTVDLIAYAAEKCNANPDTVVEAVVERDGKLKVVLNTGSTYYLDDPTEVPTVADDDVLDYDGMNMKALRAAAKAAGLTGYGKLNKTALVKRLTAA